MITNESELSTKQYIVSAILELLGLKHFELISVKEIVKKAGISRSTFYLHFQNKFDLIDTVRDDITTTFLSFYGHKENASLAVNKTTYYICQHIYDYRNFYQYEFDNPSYVQELSNTLAEKLLQVYDDKSYAIFASFGTIGYLTFWVKDGFQLSPDEAAAELVKIGVTDWSTLSNGIKIRNIL
ncbi:TetR family transcriptional regulator [Robertmurraya kyonggiensis]|uniref:TetR family transcriptional regulator n=1 Tax=Robertmurraya kyonggiensis TaxID=1037680 RepID=A0A4V5P1T8_9BACI|nr:TetR family transcriptional regulator [Robertmurraya kyonggiensis]TKC19020.1 TetR family transcriptional regulator [Robertmurraya kyonggiensis]